MGARWRVLADGEAFTSAARTYAESGRESNARPEGGRFAYGVAERVRGRVVSAVTAPEIGMVLAEGRARGHRAMRHRDRTRRRRPKALFGIILAGALAAAGAVEATSSASSVPTFSSTVDVVNLNVSVTDGKDRYVTGLA